MTSMASERTEGIRIRTFHPETDDIDELTTLLHQAYKELADMGLNYTASYQDAALTRRRIQDAHCLVGEIDDRLVGTITYYRPGLQTGGAWYCREGVGVIGQFGVLPEFKGTGIGSQLLNAVELRALQDGCRALALDTAKPATHLHQYYEHRGYRVVDFVQWEGKTYVSVIMSKDLQQ